MNTLRLLIFPFLFLILLSCRKEVDPPTISLSSSIVDLGTITSYSSSSLTLSQVGDGTISYTISSNKSWLVLSKNGNTLNKSDLIIFAVVATNSDLVEGENVATLTITPTINGSPGTPIEVLVKGNYKLTTLKPQTSTVDFGTISKPTTKYLKFSKLGIENLTYDVSSDNSWLTIDRSSGGVVTDDSLKLFVDTKKILAGTYTANITFVPKVNGNALKPIIIPVRVGYDGSINGDVTGHTLSKDETWSDVINLSGTIVIPKGFTLTVKPGTLINITKANISFQVYGKLVMNGDASNIIVLKSVNENPTYYEWGGIEYGGGDMEVSYTYIKDAVTCFDFYYLYWTSTPTKAVSLHHILFDNCQYGLYGLNSTFATNLSNLTFRNIYWASAYLLDIKDITFSNVEFNTPNAHDLRLGYGNLNVKIQNSNFVMKNYVDAYHLFIYPELSKSQINLNKCYFQTSTPLSSGFDVNGNSITNTAQLSSQISDIGCGFVNKYPNTVKIRPIMANAVELARKEKKALTKGTKIKAK